ncbi:MFS general substrate transporter [Anopheles sinensis]|uniref:MFS general substrate transporter n=1 Tax=Anopheles sinensis TaxID=74873 RepID=A0A084VFD3_ANOSI|nr:MFS general substrate transporter [Anopheles sinensis]
MFSAGGIPTPLAVSNQRSAKPQGRLRRFFAVFVCVSVLFAASRLRGSLRTSSRHFQQHHSSPRLARPPALELVFFTVSLVPLLGETGPGADRIGEDPRGYGPVTNERGGLSLCFSASVIVKRSSQADASAVAVSGFGTGKCATPVVGSVCWRLCVQAHTHTHVHTKTGGELQCEI